MKLDLLTNATVVDDAIRFVSTRASSVNSNENYKEESKEPDYYKGEDQLEEEKQNELTNNKVF
jgi:hypothetical protein